MKQLTDMNDAQMEYLFAAKDRIENLVKDGFLDAEGRPVHKK
jgi:hypothetical protein